MNLEALKQLPPWARELGSALLVVSAVFMLTWVYTGNWPPMVVIESGSMEHDDNPLYPEPGFTHIGAIDTGDLVLVKSAGRDDIVTYLAGKQQGYERYGDYGDVIIYYKNGLRGVCSAGASLDEAECNRQDGEWTPATPVIHRAMAWVEVRDNGKRLAGPWDEYPEMRGGLSRGERLKAEKEYKQIYQDRIQRQSCPACGGRNITPWGKKMGRDRRPTSKGADYACPKCDRQMTQSRHGMSID